MRGSGLLKLLQSSKAACYEKLELWELKSPAAKEAVYEAVNVLAAQQSLPRQVFTSVPCGL